MLAVLETTYFLSILSFLGGLKFLSSPKRAKLGNTLAAAGMVLALVASIVAFSADALPRLNLILIASMLVLGTFLGRIMSQKVEMTKMPQLVSFFNATGGACAMLIGVVEANQGTGLTWVQESVLLIGSATGAIAASGSIIALRKLSGKLKDRRSIGLQVLSKLFVLSLIALVVLIPLDVIGLSFFQGTLIVVGIALVYGVLFVLPIGGADMPVVISLLNAVTGIATALAGALYNNKVMLAGGIIVGAAGIILTIMMCRAMNRSLLKVLTGSFNVGSGTKNDSREQNIIQTNVSETALQLTHATRIAIIPGYGLAVAQAQHLCKQLEKLLHQRGTVVHYIIHPVAGRMPGHMNVLLAEANIDYELLKEMDEVNDEMSTYDMALVIGANDVVNPAAEEDDDSPIYGMPIIRAHECSSTVVFKRGMSKGYAGVPNKLFEHKGCKLLFGDAKTSLQEIINELKLV